MGKMQRVKGKVFERKVAKLFREAYPFLDSVRRSQQGGGAEQSDVTGVPGLWIECQDARSPTPWAKLKQAIGDSIAAEERGEDARVPIAVTHRTGSRSVEVMLMLESLCAMQGQHLEYASHTPVTLSLDDFFALARSYVQREAER